MNNPFFKLACIFIIAMFCLSPLGAIDLNQDDNNTKYVNLKDNASNILVDDEKSTDVDVKADVSDINSSTGNHSDIKKLNDTKLNSSKYQFSPKYSNFSVHIEDIKYGEYPCMEIYADKGFNGDIFIDFINSSGKRKYAWCVWMADGHARLNSDDIKLDPGTYEVKVYNKEDLGYYYQEVTTSLTVKKISPKFRMEAIGDIFYGEKAVINVLANERFNGEANVTLMNLHNDDKKVVPMKFNQGKGSITVENLTPGYYHAIVRYREDKYFIFDSDGEYFYVYGDSSPNLKVEVEGTAYDEPHVIKVSANESANGFVKIRINSSDEPIYTHLNNGYWNMDCLMI